jgi:hypothetical protein
MKADIESGLFVVLPRRRRPSTVIRWGFARRST